MSRSGTWSVRLIGFSAATGATDLSDPNQATVLGPGSGTAKLAIDASGSDFIYLDLSGTPVSVADLPPGFQPDDAFVLHHLTFLTFGGDSLEYNLSGLFDQTFTGPAFGSVPPYFTDTPLTGMTLAALTALLGSFIDLSLIAVAGGSATAESNTPFDPSFTARLDGTYTASQRLKLPPVPATSPGLQSGGDPMHQDYIRFLMAVKTAVEKLTF